MPVYELLGGRQRDFVPLFATTGAAPGPKLVVLKRLLCRRSPGRVLSPQAEPASRRAERWETGGGGEAMGRGRQGRWGRAGQSEE